MYMCVYANEYIYIYIYIHTHTYIHLYTHTQDTPRSPRPKKSISTQSGWRRVLGTDLAVPPSPINVPKVKRHICTHIHVLYASKFFAQYLYIGTHIHVLYASKFFAQYLYIGTHIHVLYMHQNYLLNTYI